MFLDVAKAAAGPARAAGKPAPLPRIKQEKPERVRAPVVKPRVKRKPQANDLSDDEFGKELEGAAPELYANLRKQVARDQAKTWFSMEMSVTPNPDWVNSRAASKAPDLEQYSEIKKLTDHLARAAACSGEHSFKLIQLKAKKELLNVRKTFIYTLECTSELALANIQKSYKSHNFFGYSLAFFQPKDSIFGQRFQVPLNNLPAPFDTYNILQWTQVLESQGWDATAITHIDFSTRTKPGDMVIELQMLDIYVKPAYCDHHGCEGALDTSFGSEKLVKKITRPPSSVALGFNPSPEAIEFIEENQLKGQYGRFPGENPEARPLDRNNAMMESSGCFLPRQHLNKTFIRNVIKVGCCSFCWAIQGHNKGEICLYKGFCKECCAEIATLPHKGFHHACQSFITSTPDHRKMKGEKRQRNIYDVGTPTDESQLQYIPSESSNKRAKLAAALQVKRQKREADQAKMAAEKAARKAKEDAEKVAAEAADGSVAEAVAGMDLDSTGDLF